MRVPNLKLVLAVTMIFSMITIPMVMSRPETQAILRSNMNSNTYRQLGLNSLLQQPCISGQSQVTMLSAGIDTMNRELPRNGSINEVAPVNDVVQNVEPSGDMAVVAPAGKHAPDLNGTKGVDSEIGLVLYGRATGKSSYSAGGGVGTDAYDPNRPAQEMDITRDGHWFPNKDYSRICYEISEYRPATGQVYIKIARVEDQYSRYFRVYLDTTKIFEGVMSYGFDGYIYPNNVLGVHKLILEIQWGYYSDHGWKLVNIKPTSCISITGEFFPNKDYSRLRWNVYIGSATQINLRIDSAGDPYARNLRIYVDGVLKVTYSVPTYNLVTFNLGDYAKHTSHEVIVEVQWGYYMDWGWKLVMFKDSDPRYMYGVQFSIYYAAVYFEIDYMDGHYPSADVLNYIKNYYISHGSERPVLDPYPELVPHEDVMRLDLYHDDYVNLYYNVHFQHKGQTDWNYILYGHYDDIGAEGGYGYCRKLGTDAYGYGILIADQRGHDYADDPYNHNNGGVTRFQTECVSMMHEIGHSLRIVDLDAYGNEVYCDQGGNSYCVMAQMSWDNCDDNPFYCTHHWAQRIFP